MTAHFPHPLTNAQRQAAHRAKVKLKLARLERYEATLREITELGSDGEHSGDRHAKCRAIARNALNAEAEA